MVITKKAKFIAVILLAILLALLMLLLMNNQTDNTNETVPSPTVQDTDDVIIEQAPVLDSPLPGVI